MTDRNDEDSEKDKEPRNGALLFSEEQVAFLRTLLAERGPPMSGKGKGPAKKFTEDAENPDERLGTGG